MQAQLIECERPQRVLETLNRGLTAPPRASRRTAEMQPNMRDALPLDEDARNIPVPLGRVLPKKDAEDIRAWLLRLRAAEAGERR